MVSHIGCGEGSGFVSSVNKMPGARSSRWWFSRLISSAFQDWKYADKRQKRKEDVQNNAQIPFFGQTGAFPYEIAFWGIQPCFLHGESERLACFEPTKAARFLKTLEENSALYCQRKYLFKREFLYLFDIGLKEKPQNVYLKLIFYHVLSR